MADFGALESTRKVASRLELMASHAMSSCLPKTLKASQFEIIDQSVSKATNDYMGDGCGFIPDHLMHLVIGGNPDKRLSIQVRIFAPHLGQYSLLYAVFDNLKHLTLSLLIIRCKGIWKGILCRKSGIDKIQLTPSMRKVGRSITATESEDWACVVVVKHHPSQANTDVSKYHEGGHLSASFELKELSRMVVKLWKCLGVPSQEIKHHKKPRCPENGYVVGLADPTGLLPAGILLLFALHVCAYLILYIICTLYLQVMYF